MVSMGNAKQRELNHKAVNHQNPQSGAADSKPPLEERLAQLELFFHEMGFQG